MKCTCPNCGISGDIALFLSGDDAQEFLRLYTQLPPSLARPLLGYLGLFRPAKQHLTPARGARLLGQLLPLIQAQQAQRDGLTFAAPHGAWQTAFETMQERREKLTLPLDGHGYLLAILASEARAPRTSTTQAPEGLSPKGRKTASAVQSWLEGT